MGLAITFQKRFVLLARYTARDAAIADTDEAEERVILGERPSLAAFLPGRLDGRELSEYLAVPLEVAGLLRLLDFLSQTDQVGHAANVNRFELRCHRVHLFSGAWILSHGWCGVRSA